MQSSETTRSTSSMRIGCANCKRKQLYSIKCKCDQNLCANCRYPEAHNCQFDYAAAGRAEIAKNNPTVISKKIDKV